MNNRRASSRQKALLHGRIHFNNRQSIVECLVRDLSGEGARLKVSESIAVPATMELYIAARDEWFRANVQWRRGDEMGVALVSDNVASPSPNAATVDVAARFERLESDVATLQRLVRELRLEQRRRQFIE